MPRKTKEPKEELNNTAETVTKKATASKKSATATAKATTKKAVTSTTKTATEKATTSTAKSATKKSKTVSEEKVTKPRKSTSRAKKASTEVKEEPKITTSKAKKVASKTTTKRTRKVTSKKAVDLPEYYDLPYRYNQTIVKVLAQTPTNLFIYWDISDTDRKNFEKQYGEDFFQNTKPVLIVYNDTLGYSFEVEINDFANSWYLHVADSKCDYRIELGRRPIVKAEELKNENLRNTNYIYVTTSNEMESPNDKILFNKEQKMVYFRDVKTGTTTEKPITSLSFMTNMGKIYNIYDLYKTIYKNENVEEIYDLKNPSSHPSS